MSGRLVSQAAPQLEIHGRMSDRITLKLLILMTVLVLIGCGTEHGSAIFSTICRSEPVKATKPMPCIAFDDNFERGMQTADETGRPSLVFFTLPQCSNGNQMLDSTFRNNEIQSLSRRFVCIMIDASKHATLCEKYQVKGFPTILLLSPQGIELQRMSGKQNADQLSVQMQVALQSTAQKAVASRK